MKIVFSELERGERDFIRERLSKYKLEFIDGTINSGNLQKIKDCEILAVFIDSKLSGKELANFQKLKMITTMSTGYDHIDLEYCEKNNIVSCNVPTYGENTVAEHAFGLILTLSRKLYEAINRTKEDNFSIDGLQGFDLRGKTLGVIGTGHIGMHLIKIARGFEMEIIAYDRFPNNELSKTNGYRYVSMDYLLKNSDIISLHVPLLKDTLHIIDKNAVKKMKRGVYLINTSRGELIDSEALLYGLNRKIIGGAGLDVLEGEINIKEEHELLKKKHLQTEEWETFLKNHFLLKKHNVVVTPHSAFYSKEALRRISETTVENIESFIKNKPINRVFLRR